MSIIPPTPASTSASSSSSSSSSASGSPRFPSGRSRYGSSQFTFLGTPTPPESPISQYSSNPESDIGNSEASAAGMCPLAILCGNGVYPLGQIQAMTDELTHARASREFPPCAASPRDPKFVVEDYRALCHLRSLRGDPSRPAPEAYNQFLIEATRRIQDRDDAFDDEEKREEAVRRVDSFVQAVGYEKEYFEAVNQNTLSRRRGVEKKPSQLDLNKASEEIFGIVEHVVEQTMADAATPLRANIGRLGSQAADFQEQNDTYSRQLDLHYRNIEQHSAQCLEIIKALNSLFGPQAEATKSLNSMLGSQAETMQSLSTMLEHQSRNNQVSADNVLMFNALYNNSLRLIASLPSFIEQINAVQTQTKQAFRDLMEEQRKEMVTEFRACLREDRKTRDEESKMFSVEGQQLEVKAMDASIEKTQSVGRSDEVKGNGRLRRMMKRVFRR